MFEFFPFYVNEVKQPAYLRGGELMGKILVPTLCLHQGQLGLGQFCS
jgi:hypothetical protein